MLIATTTASAVVKTGVLVYEIRRDSDGGVEDLLYDAVHNRHAGFHHDVKAVQHVLSEPLVPAAGVDEVLETAVEIMAGLFGGQEGG